MDILKLKGKTIVVTGAAGNIGRAICCALETMGCTVIGIDLKEALDREIINSKYKVGCDLENEKEIESIFTKELKDIDSIDGIVNNAAFVGTRELKGWNTVLEEQSLDTWRRCVEVNLNAPFKMVQQAINKLEKADNGSSVVNISSIYGMVGPQWDMYEGTNMGNPAAYAASKGGLIQLTRWMATTISPKVRVNCISAGGIYRKQDEKFVNKYISKTPMRRMGTEKDVVNGVIYLLSDMSSYITGHNLVIDGGWTAW